MKALSMFAMQRDAGTGMDVCLSQIFPFLLSLTGRGTLSKDLNGVLQTSENLTLRLNPYLFFLFSPRFFRTYRKQKLENRASQLLDSFLFPSPFFFFLGDFSPPPPLSLSNNCEARG